MKYWHGVRCHFQTLISCIDGIEELPLYEQFEDGHHSDADCIHIKANMLVYATIVHELTPEQNVGTYCHCFKIYMAKVYDSFSKEIKYVIRQRQWA